LTHSLHRQGSIQDLKKDYVILAMLAAGFNDKYPDSRQKLLKVAEILNNNHPSNIMPEFAWKVSSVITAVYDDIENVKQTVSDLKREDLGISIVVTGLISDVKEILKEADLNMHTIHLSLGVFGKKELLPKEKKVIEMTTMCGHHCISPQSIDYYVDLIKKQKISTEKAAEKLAKPCICGIFNTSRAIEKLTLLASNKS
jgi:hypothetical protein